MFKKSLIIAVLLIGSHMAEAQPRFAWLRTYGGDQQDSFQDIYRCVDNEYALCGQTEPPQGQHDFWLVVVDENGEIVLDRNYDARGLSEGAYSLVQTDDNGFILVGTGIPRGNAFDDVEVFRVDANGEAIWNANFGGDNIDEGRAVIELKEGNYFICGYTRSMGNGRKDGYIIKCDDNGNSIWQRTYGTQSDDYLYAMREIDGGAILVGYSTGDNWVLRIDNQGEQISSRVFGGDGGQLLNCLVSCAGEGYAAAGYGILEGDMFFQLVRLDQQGASLWERRYDFEGDSSFVECNNIAKMADGGFTLVGEMGGRRESIVILRTDSDGNEMWRSITEDPVDDNEPNWNYLFGLIEGFDGSILACGSTMTNAGGLEGLLAKLVPERSSPTILQYYPDSLEFNALRGDSTLFWVVAEDLQGDSIRYTWLVQGDAVSDNDSCAVVMAEIGDLSVFCSVGDGELSDSIRWNVSVLDLYIAASSPDTLSLALRRGTSQTFSLDTVRAVEGDPVQYQWTLTNLDNFERENAGSETGTTVEFLRSGNYQMEGLAYRGESSDNVIWTIAVRSAILDFWPRELHLSVPPDSSGEFGVIPFNPESDSLSYRWEVDGDSVGSDSTVALRFAWNGQAGRSTYAVNAIVMDGEEGDTVRWEVTVQDPNATPPTPPSIEGGESPSTFGIVSVSPNPFNNSTTIRFTVPFGSESAQSTKSAVRLMVHDVMGREVAKLMGNRAQQSPPSRGGSYAVTFDGKDLPAGIYLVKLQAGEMQKVAKVVLVR